jgi:hypothetical protein
MMGGMGTSADAGDALAAQGHTPYLPEPTGPCPAGTTSVWLTDTSRPDPWALGVTARELLVSLWYPAVPSDGRRARYMTPAESELQLTSRGIGRGSRAGRDRPERVSKHGSGAYHLSCASVS